MLLLFVVMLLLQEMISLTGMLVEAARGGDNEMLAELLQEASSHGTSGKRHAGNGHYEERHTTILIDGVPTDLPIPW